MIDKLQRVQETAFEWLLPIICDLDARAKEQKDRDSVLVFHIYLNQIAEAMVQICLAADGKLPKRILSLIEKNNKMIARNDIAMRSLLFEKAPEKAS